MVIIMIYLFLANGFEEIEAIAPLDILRRAELEVITVGVTGKTVRGAHGITVAADIEAKDATLEHLDMVVLPGGMPGTLNLEKSEIVQYFIDFCAHNDKWLAAICAAPSILGHAGLLNGRRYTCFPGYETQGQEGIYTAAPVEQDGKLVTAAGAGVALEFGFKLVEVLLGRQRADGIKAAMQCRDSI